LGEQREEESSVCLIFNDRFLGLDNAGKSSILNRLTNGGIHTVSPTRGYNIKQADIDGTSFAIWDIGGQNSLRSQWTSYLEQTKGIVWVIDSSDRRRMYETGLELAALLQDEKLSGVPVLIFANKQDLITAMKSAEITIELELHSIRNRNWHIQDCSALEGTGLSEGMRWLNQSIN